MRKTKDLILNKLTNRLITDRSKIRRKEEKEINMLKSRATKTKIKETQSKKRSYINQKSRSPFKISSSHNKRINHNSKTSQLSRYWREGMRKLIISSYLLMRNLIRIRQPQQDRFNRSKRTHKLHSNNNSTLSNLNTNLKLRFKMKASMQVSHQETTKTRIYNTDKYSLRSNKNHSMIRKVIIDKEETKVMFRPLMNLRSKKTGESYPSRVNQRVKGQVSLNLHKLAKILWLRKPRAMSRPHPSRFRKITLV